MKQRRQAKPQKSFKENAIEIIPLFYDEMMSNAERVIAHARLQEEFHTMRLAGKQLRFAMEFFSPAFGTEFKDCLSALRSLLEIMGNVHEHDIAISLLKEHLLEIRTYNQSAKTLSAKISPKLILQLLRQQRTLRTETFQEFSISKWILEDSRTRLLKSMNNDN
jgi:CHAD domain-containing protein